jgi:hypothetical protein
LHFSGRKRRIRRSLGTSCVEEAIRRRDELFARIERDGEEVPERKRESPEEGEMRPLVTGLLCVTVASYLASA